MRDKYIDRVRGFAIILVVLGHAIQRTYVDFDTNCLFTLIYSFHMPLFMFISGYVTYKENRKTDNEWMVRRVTSLLVPFLIWIPLPYIFNWDNHAIIIYIMRVIKDPTCSSWFLWVLFLLSLSMWIIYQIVRLFHIKEEILFFIYVICMLLVNNLTGELWLGIGLVAKFSVYYFGGYVYKKWFESNFSTKKRRILTGILTMGWIVFVPLWRRVGYHAVFSGQLLNKGIIRPVVKIVDAGFDYAIGFGGIAISFLIVWLIHKIYKGQVLEKLGTKTLEIYLLHQFWFYMVDIKNSVYAVILESIFGLGISYFIAELFAKNSVGMFLFGKRQ